MQIEALEVSVYLSQASIGTLPPCLRMQCVASDNPNVLENILRAVSLDNSDSVLIANELIIALNERVFPKPVGAIHFFNRHIDNSEKPLPREKYWEIVSYIIKRQEAQVPLHQERNKINFPLYPTIHAF